MLQLFQGAAKLIGATGALATTLNAIKALDDLVGRHAYDQFGKSLRVPLATTMKEAVTDAAVLDLHVNELAASALCLIQHYT